MAKITEADCDTRTQMLARVCYQTYIDNSDGLNFRGEPCPPWAELPSAIRGHWCAVALRVRDRVVITEGAVGEVMASPQPAAPGAPSAATPPDASAIAPILPAPARAATIPAPSGIGEAAHGSSAPAPYGDGTRQMLDIGRKGEAHDTDVREAAAALRARLSPRPPRQDD